MDGEMQLPVCPGVMRVMRNANACYGSKQTTREAREGKFYNDLLKQVLGERVSRGYTSEKFITVFRSQISIYADIEIKVYIFIC